MLDQKRLKLIELMIDGVTSKTELASLIKVSRQSIYDWLSESEVQAELDRRLAQAKTIVDKKISSQLEPVVDELYKIALKAKDVRMRNSACQYLINRVLGTPTSNVNVDGTIDTPENTSEVLADFKTFMDSVKDKKKDLAE